MPWLPPGWTRKDTQHFPILTMTKKPSMLYIPEILRHYTECQDFSLDYQKRYTTFPYMNHKWKTKYVIYPRSAQPLHWMPGPQPGWTRKDTQHFPIFTMTEKLSMLYIPEALRHYTECQDFSLGEPKRKDNFPYINREWKTKYAIYPRRTLHSVPGQTTFISYINLWNMTNNNQKIYNLYIMVYISEVIRQHKTK